MSDRIWILGPFGAWHCTTVEAIDAARAEDRQLVASCNKLVSVHDKITISTEEPETGVCGGCFIKMLSPMGDLEIECDRGGFDFSQISPAGQFNRFALSRDRAQMVGRHLRDQSWHKAAKVLDVNLIDLSVP